MTARTTLSFPPIVPAQITWTLLRPGDQFAGNAFTGGGVSIERFGLWRASVQMKPMLEANAAIFEAFLSRLARAGSVVWVPAWLRSGILGSFSAAEGLTNGTFLADTSGWTASGSALTFNSRRLKIKNSGAAAGQARQAVAGLASTPHCLSVLFGRGSVDDYAVNVGTTAGASDLVSSGTLANLDGYHYVSPAFTATDPTHVTLICQSTTAGDFVNVERASLRRCGQVAGASQTGSLLATDGWPISTTGLLLTGDFIGVAGRLHRLTQDLDTNSSGQGTLFLTPEISVAPADNAPVLVGGPLVQMRLATNEAAVSVTAPFVSAFAFDLIETLS